MLRTKSFVVYSKPVFKVDGCSSGKFKNCTSTNIRSMNFKFFKNGVIIISGCKNYDDLKAVLGEYQNHQFFVISMLTIYSFNCSCKTIDLQKLSKLVQEMTDYHVFCSKLRLKIVIPLPSIHDLIVHVLDKKNESLISYEKFLTLNIKTRAETAKKITLQVFNSGAVIVSGIDEYYDLPIITWLKNLVENNINKIERKIEFTCSFHEYI